MRVMASLMLSFLLFFSSASRLSAFPDLDFVGDGLSYLKTDQPLAVRDLVTMPPQAFQETHNFQPNLGFSFKTIWFKTAVKNRSNREASFVFEVAYPRLEEIDFYAVDELDAVKFEYRAGTERDKTLLPISHLSVAFPIKIVAGQELRFFMRTKTDSPIRFPVRIWDSEEFRAHQQSFQLTQGLYYGAILIMIIYNMFVFFATGSRSYLYYCLFVLSTGCYLASDGGMLLQYVFTKSCFWNNKISLFSILSANICGIYFANNFMNLKSNDPPVNRFIKRTLPLLYAMGLIIPAVPYYIGGLTLTLLSTFSSVLLIAITIRGLLRKQRESYFYAAAWTSLLLGTFAYGLLALGFINSNFFTERGLQIGSLFEVTILSFALADRLNQMRKGLKGANEQLAYQIAHVEEQVHIKTRDIRSIMEHIPLGVFSIDAMFLVHKDYSRSMETLFHSTEIAGRNALDLLFQQTQLSVDRRAQMNTALSLSLGEDKLAFELNRHCFIDRILLQKSAESRTYDLLWNPVCNNQGCIEKILVTVHDSTQFLALVQGVELQKLEMAIIQKILEVPVSRFHSFLHSSEQLLADCAQITTRSRASVEDRHQYLMNIHTLKGTSRALFFNDISDKCHKLEEDAGKHPLQDLHEDLRGLEQLLDKYKDIAVSKLGRKLLVSASVEVDTLLLRQVLSDLVEGSQQPLTREVSARIQKMENILYFGLQDVLRECLKSNSHLAKDLGKAQPRMEVDGAEFGVTKLAYETLFSVLTHLVRNSLDHGLELPETRTKEGKQAAGTISIHVHTEGDQLQLIFRDDGRGLSMQELRAMGLNRGIIQDNASQQSIAELIFAPDFSTKDAVSSTSGRGMGMAAVREILRNHGGDITLELLAGYSATNATQSFALKLLLPQHFWTKLHVPMSMSA